jgi:hypothetical protein
LGERDLLLVTHRVEPVWLATHDEVVRQRRK